MTKNMKCLFIAMVLPVLSFSAMSADKMDIKTTNILPQTGPAVPHDQNRPPAGMFPVRSDPDRIESPLCTYNDSRYSEGAMIPLNTKSGQLIVCSNRTDGSGRFVAIWKPFKEN